MADEETVQIDYPSACNAAETLLVHQDLLHTLWIQVARALLRAGVQLICDGPTLSAIPGSVDRSHPNMIASSHEESYRTEHLDLKLSVKTVDSLDAAIRHINTHSSHHTDTIITESEADGSRFCRGVDSAGTFINASTRFADGFRYGFGTEVGISTGRIHARGPVGLEGLVIYKYMMRSKDKKGHIVGDFGVGEGKKRYKHTPIETSGVSF